MHPELLAAVRERVDLGHSKDEIRTELQAAGYDDQTIEEVYQEAFSGALPRSADIDNSHVYPENDELSQTPGHHSASLPSASDLFGNGWSFLQSRLDLLLVLGIPFAITVVLDFLSENSGSNGLSLIANITELLAFVFYLYAWVASVYIVVKSNDQKISVGDGFAWARKNILSLIWINFLAGAVVMGGYMLLIVPGIILSFYLYFSQYVYIKEGTRGISALLRSRDIVKGRAWPLAGRVLMLALMFFVVFLGLGLLAGLVAGLIGAEGGIVDMILDVVFQFISAGAALIVAHAGVELYNNMVVLKPASATVVAPQGRGKYIALAWLGFLSVPIMIFMIFTLFALSMTEDMGTTINDTGFDIDTKERAMEMRAEQLRQDIIDAEDVGVDEILPEEGVNLDQVEEI